MLACRLPLTIGLASDCYSEQDAAEGLGFTELSWDNWSNEEEQPSSLYKIWDELTDEEEKAAEYLGYTQFIWDTQQPPAAQKFWSDLTEPEIIAATALGYTELNWDNMSGEEEQPPSNSKTWDLMTDEELTSLEVLGYTETNFGNWPMPLPDSMSTPWHELTTCGEILSLTHPSLQ